MIFQPFVKGHLTYMSIRDQIISCVEDGRLVHLKPMLDMEPPVRTLLVSPEVNGFAVGPWRDVEDEVRAAKLRFALDRFTLGQPISISKDPYTKAKASYMAPIDPVTDRVYQIRNRDEPGIRIMGGFSEKDTFIALVWDYRKNLGGPGDRAWRDLRERCKTEWNNRIPTYKRLSGDNRNDLASNIIHE